MLESVFRQLLACALEPRTPSVEAGGQCDPCRNAGFPLERLSPSPPYRCSTGFHRFSWSRMPVVCASTGLSLPAPEPGCHGVCSGAGGGWVIVTEHFIHTYFVL